VTIAASATQTKSFRVGAVINSTAANPLTVFGWQFAVEYNPTYFIPQGDPGASSYPDGAVGTVLFGSQTASGTINWAAKIASNQAFGGISICQAPFGCGEGFPLDKGKILVFFTTLFPSPSSTISANTLLANVNFEVVKKPTTPQFLNITDVTFVDSQIVPIPSVFEGPSVVETITNAPPVASFVSSHATNIGPFAFSFNASASLDPDGSIANPAGYFWDFGDGTQDLGISGKVVTHDYGVNGTFVATLRVQDNLGMTGASRDGSGGLIFNNQPSHQKLAAGYSSDIPPTASFTFSNTLLSYLFDFNAANSTDIDGRITVYNWQFGDGFNFSTTDPTIQHQYRHKGAFTVTLTVEDDAGLTGTVSNVVTVLQVPDLPPVAVFTWIPSIPTAGQPVFFFGNQSYDPDGFIMSWFWNFGDNSAASGPVVSHTYNSSGNYTVVLSVMDNASMISQAIFTIPVAPASNDLPPVASFTFSTGNATTGQTVFFNGGGSYDPDGFIQSWSWSFGDSFTGSGSQTFHTYNSQGNFLVTLTVTDNVGLSASASAVVSVRVDVSPVASFTFTPPSPTAGQQVFFDASASYDPDGYIQTWLWSFGDGYNYSSYEPQITHTFNSPGNYTVTLRVQDNAGLSSAASLTVPVRPKPAHDVSVVSVNAYPQKVVSSQSVGIQVVLANNGSNNETVSVTAYYGGNVIKTITGVLVPTPCYYCSNYVYVQIIWDTTGVPAGNYTISATVFLPTDQNPSDNTKTDGQVQVLPPPTLSASPASGVPGTTVTLHGSNFPPLPYPGSGIGYVEVTFDDQLIGFTNTNDGMFNFTFSIPLSQPGPHLIKALDEYSLAHASISFQVLAPPAQASLAVSIQAGSIYFPTDTVVAYAQVTLNGQATTPSAFLLQLYLPNGSVRILTTQLVGPGLYKATFPVPKTNFLGTYLLVGTAHNAGPLDATSLASFEVKQSWINSNSSKITAGATLAAVLGLATISWRKGYFRKKRDETPAL